MVYISKSPHLVLIDADSKIYHLVTRRNDALSPTTSVTSKKAPRMNNDRKTQLKKAEKVREYKTRGQGTYTPGLGSASEASQTTGTLKTFSGECPPSNSSISWVCDSYEKKAYMVGGIQPSDDSLMPTTDFYRLDITTMKWTNLMVKWDQVFYFLQICL